MQDGSAWKEKQEISPKTFVIYCMICCALKNENVLSAIIASVYKKQHNHCDVDKEILCAAKMLRLVLNTA